MHAFESLVVGACQSVEFLLNVLIDLCLDRIGIRLLSLVLMQCVVDSFKNGRFHFVPGRFDKPSQLVHLLVVACLVLL